MKPYNRETDGPLVKGQLFMDNIGWVGVVMEAEKTKRYSEYNIINCVDIFGFEHEAGSKYANEVRFLLTENEFNSKKAELGFEKEDTIYKGQLIGV